MQAIPEFFFIFMKKYTSKEIIPDSIEIDGTTIMRQTEVKLFCTTTQQKTKFCYAVNELDYV